MQTVARYDRIAAAIHWLTAVMVLLLIPLALFSDPIGKALGFSAIALHKSLGMTVFGLTLVRVFWWIGHRAPPLPESTPAIQRVAAHGAHGLLYLLLLGLPLSGYVLGSGGPYPMQWFGMDVPKAAISKPVADVFHAAHELGGYTIIALLVLHIGAASWHQWVQRDNLIARMSLAARPR